MCFSSFPVFFEERFLAHRHAAIQKFILTLKNVHPNLCFKVHSRVFPYKSSVLPVHLRAWSKETEGLPQQILGALWHRMVAPYPGPSPV